MFVPGHPAAWFPLSRHLPPVGQGIAAAYAEQYSAPGDLIVDPFGQSPQVALEACRLNRRVVLANNNPVLRFALHAALDPCPTTVLRAALTRLADARLPDGRVETSLRRLYSAACPDCGAAVEVDAFVWDKEALVEKSYYCERCGEEKTRPADPADLELAAKFPPQGVHYYWALDRVAPPDDPDRPFVAGALEAYTPRALHALFTLTYKAHTLDLASAEQRAVELLLLLAYDAGTSLEGPRPRSLRPRVRFREKNIWLALERLVKEEDRPPDGGGPAAPVAFADVLQGQAPAVAVFEGSVRDLTRALNPESVPLMIAPLPRPNPVLWALSTVWAAWLWGGEAAGSMKGFVRRRRYDWAWHEQALRSGLAAGRDLLEASGRLVALIPEAEAGFVGAALTAADASGLALLEGALRPDPPEAQFVFEPDRRPLEGGSGQELARRQRAESAAVAVIGERGEPLKWHVLSGAAFMALAGAHLLRSAVREIASDPFDAINADVEAACLESAHLIRMVPDPAAGLKLASGESLRAGWWWLADPGGSAEPLADRVEAEIARLLPQFSGGPEAHDVAIDRRACAAFPGLLTPEAALVGRILESYGEEHHTVWGLRPEDDPAGRAEDVERIAGDVRALGRRLGFETRQAAGRAEIEWHDADEGRVDYRFHICESAAIAPYVYTLPPDDARRVMVVPGGRSGLIEYKLRRDPRLRAAVEQGRWLFVKFRHLRRLLAEPALDRTALLTVFGLDPIVEQGTAQLPLL